LSSPSPAAVRESLRGKPVVVILGGGNAGILIAKALETEVNVVVVDRKDHFYHQIATPRAVVTSSIGWRLTIPYTHLLKYGHVIQGDVTEVQATSIKLLGREELLHFDYLVVATGYGATFPNYESFTSAQQAVTSFEESARAIKEVSPDPLFRYVMLFHPSHLRFSLLY